jgi:hypothetical protein
MPTTRFDLPSRPALLAVCLLLLSSCFTTYDRPDLGSLYNQAAQYHRPERNPIVVIPGLMGSKLEDPASGRIVWGAFTHRAAHPGDPEGARLIALPMERGVPLSGLRDEVVATEVLDRVKVRFLGLPLQLKAYFNLLGALGAGGYRDESLGLLGGIDYGEGHFTCFQFPYDWRRDTVENARRLHEFLLKKRAYVQTEIEKRFGVPDADVRFDLVTHSLGGLVARYYLRYGTEDLPEDGSLPAVTWAGADLVERAVLVAPPNGGSLEALFNLVEGRSFGGPIGPDYPPALLGTFPVGYQLLPRPEYRAVVRAGKPDEPVGNLWDPELWKEMGWGLADPDQAGVLETLLPEIRDPEERRTVALDHLEKSLRRAQRFTAALDRPAEPPPGLDIYLVVGDAVPTARRVAVVTEPGPSRGRLEVIEQQPGDGTVLRSSALMDGRLTADGPWSPIHEPPVAWSNVLFLFTDHLGLTKDPAFTDNVLYWLLEEPRERS